MARAGKATVDSRRATWVDPPYTTRLQKGGALLAEMKRVLLEWDGTPACAQRIIESNVLSSPTRARTRDVVTRAFIPRFVQSHPPDLWKSVSVLERAGWPQERLLPIHYYVAAAAEPVLWDFVVEVLADRYGRSQLEVRVEDVLKFLAQAPGHRFPTGRWSEAVRVKVARGLLAALRDFGLLAGATKKRISPLYLPAESFAFIAMIRHVLGVRGQAAVGDPCWHLFYLGDLAVERFFIEAHQRKLLEYHAAGSVVRIEFPAPTLEEYGHALVERAD